MAQDNAKKTNILMVLGSPNSAQGELSELALKRAETAIKEYKKRSGCKLLLTGGFGAHFNTTQHPHAYYVANFLTSHGIPSSEILEFAESSNTVEDALLSYRILRSMNVGTIYILTAGFHMKRVKLIFKHIFSGSRLVFIKADCQLAAVDLKELRRHEKEAIKKLKDAKWFDEKHT